MSSATISLFAGGEAGEWQVSSAKTLSGPEIPAFDRLAIGSASDSAPAGSRWLARGFNSNLRYTTRLERQTLLDNAAQPDRGDQCAVLIPMSKSAAWWNLAQDERLTIYARSDHTQIGLAVLPAVFRRLYHSRDLGEAFDFLTWFEFAADAEPAFDAMLAELRSSEEWHFVSAESEIRLRR